MLQPADFSFSNMAQPLDFRGFVMKTLSYWKWLLLGVVLALFVAYQVNIRSQKMYGIKAVIAVKEENNPLFTSNTSLIFNWGGTSDKVQTIASTLQSRLHNEVVVSKLRFYIDYGVQEPYFMRDAYGEVPFEVLPQTSQFQWYNRWFKVQFTDPTHFTLTAEAAEVSASLICYATGQQQTTAAAPSIRLQGSLGVPIHIRGLSVCLQPSAEPAVIGKSYFFKYANFDQTVAHYQRLQVRIDEKAASILEISLEGTNKKRLVDYLNTTVEVLKQRQLEQKNQFAINTIAFIDTTLQSMEAELKNAGEALKDFSRTNNVIEIERGGEGIQEHFFKYDLSRTEIERKQTYYQSLKKYLQSATDFSKLPAPAVAGIDDPNLVRNVAQLIDLSVRRSQMGYMVKSTQFYAQIDNEIEGIKKVLLRNIEAAQQALQLDAQEVQGKLTKVEATINRLPVAKQEFYKILRKYNLSDNLYNIYLQKRSEALIVKAANLSDIQFIDTAKDTGGGLIGPKEEVNYAVALMAGVLLPLLVLFVKFYTNQTLLNIEELQQLTQIPIMGVVGIKPQQGQLTVFESPKSALSESFRAIRTSLQFLYKKQDIQGARTLMVTSSTSGEGKTYCSANIATVFALSDKKTLLIGMDLRKPSLQQLFKPQHEIGLVNYLIGTPLQDVIQSTQIPYLDVLMSGPIPPNPAELLLSDAVAHMFEQLRTQYDYIIIDTPPVGMVADALELTPFVDVCLYIVRQNYTRKDMITVLNNRHKRGELNQISIIFNGFESKARYGSSYHYSSGYGDYSQSYVADNANLWQKLRFWIKQKT